MPRRGPGRAAVPDASSSLPLFPYTKTCIHVRTTPNGCRVWAGSVQSGEHDPRGAVFRHSCYTCLQYLGGAQRRRRSPPRRVLFLPGAGCPLRCSQGYLTPRTASFGCPELMGRNLASRHRRGLQSRKFWLVFLTWTLSNDFGV